MTPQQQQKKARPRHRHRRRVGSFTSQLVVLLLGPFFLNLLHLTYAVQTRAQSRAATGAGTTTTGGGGGGPMPAAATTTNTGGGGGGGLTNYLPSFSLTGTGNVLHDWGVAAGQTLAVAGYTAFYTTLHHYIPLSVMISLSLGGIYGPEIVEKVSQLECYQQGSEDYRRVLLADHAREAEARGELAQGGGGQEQGQEQGKDQTNTNATTSTTGETPLLSLWDHVRIGAEGVRTCVKGVRPWAVPTSEDKQYYQEMHTSASTAAWGGLLFFFAASLILGPGRRLLSGGGKWWYLLLAAPLYYILPDMLRSVEEYVRLDKLMHRAKSSPASISSKDHAGYYALLVLIHTMENLAYSLVGLWVASVMLTQDDELFFLPTKGKAGGWTGTLMRWVGLSGGGATADEDEGEGEGTQIKKEKKEKKKKKAGYKKSAEGGEGGEEEKHLFEMAKEVIKEEEEGIQGLMPRAQAGGLAPGEAYGETMIPQMQHHYPVPTTGGGAGEEGGEGKREESGEGRGGGRVRTQEELAQSPRYKAWKTMVQMSTD